MKTYSIRLFPTNIQITNLYNLSRTRLSIYNFFLNKNIERYKSEKKIYSAYDTHKMVTIEKNNHPEWRLLNAKCIQTTLTHLYDNYLSFFVLIKKDKSARPPQIIENIDDFRTISFNQSGWSIKPNNIIEINRIPLKYKSIYNLKELDIKEIRVKLINKKWMCDLVINENITKPSEKLIQNKVLAIDLGLEKLATGVDSLGNTIIVYNKPKKISKYFNKRINAVKSKQAKCLRNSRRWTRIQLRKNKLYNKKNTQIRNRLHIESKRLINMNYNTIVVGDLKTKKLMEMPENKYKKVSRSFGNSNVSMFLNFLIYKGNHRGINVIKVNEQYTTQINCLTGKLFGDKVKLSDRVVRLNDGIEIDRDLNSAINIYHRFMDNHLAALTPPLPLAEVLMRNNLLFSNKKTGIRNNADSGKELLEPTTL